MNILNTSETLLTGGVTITYTGQDSAGNPCHGTITVTPQDQAPEDQAPTAGADVAAAAPGETIAVDVLANDADPEGGALSIIEATAESGSVTIGADNVLSYTAPSHAGTDTITYTVSDAGGNTTIGTVAVTVTTVDQPPVAGEDAATVPAGGTVSIDVLANDTDPEGGALSLTEATAENGSVTVADNLLSYTAAVGFTGSDAVTYTVRDSAGHTTTGTVRVMVEAVDLPPETREDVADAVAGETTSIDVLANDTDPEGKPLTVTRATAAKGSVTVAADGKLSYTAPAGFSGVDTITYTISDAAGNTDEGQVAVTVTSLQLVIDPQTEVGDFAVEAMSGEIRVTIIEPADYADTHLIQTADLQQGPINLVPPRITGATTPGSTLTAVPGIWAGDETHGAIGFTQQWLRGSTKIEGATGSSYVIQSGDAVSGLHYSRQATNTAGTRSITVEALAKDPTAGQTFVERGVRFTAPARLIRNADLAPSDSQNVLWFVSLVPHATGRQGILRQSSINNGVQFWDGKFQFQAVSRIVDSRPLTAGQRANFLCTATASGSTTVLRLYSRLAGESGWTAERTDDGGSGPVDLTFGGFSVGGRHGGTGHNLNATVYRLAFWSDVAVDLGDPAVFGKFLKADGTLVDPAVSRGAFGTPRVDLYGPAEDYAARVNRGTAGNFDIVEGTFTNA